MPYSFEWPEQIREAMRLHVASALSRLEPDRYSQEPAYVAALIARLDGVVYDGREGRVEIIGTIVDDRGRRSAESQWGADFVISAALVQEGRRSKKAVLGQAKRGSTQNLSSSRHHDLEMQCHKMLRATPACLVLETPLRFGDVPQVRLLGEDGVQPVGIGDYLVDRLMTCSHGDTTGDFVRAVRDSRLSGLHLLASSTNEWPA